MKRHKFAFALAAIVSGLMGTGCGDRNQPAEPASNSHDEHAHEEADGAHFEPGKGIELAPEAATSIGLETATVGKQELMLKFTATARVFHASHQHAEGFPGYTEGHAYAHAVIPMATADALSLGQSVTLTSGFSSENERNIDGTLARMDRETTPAIGQVEAVIDIADPETQLEFGAFFTAHFTTPAARVTAVPLSALVNAATGRFVYVQNNDRWLRTPVTIGGANDEFVEIREGLSSGDVVASRGATDLWLIELRFTKGGGHSH